MKYKHVRKQQSKLFLELLQQNELHEDNVKLAKVN